MQSKSGFTRRAVVVGSSAVAAALSLDTLLFPGVGHASTPKKGGKLVYAIQDYNNRHKSAATAKHPKFGLEDRTNNTYDALTWVDENLEVVPLLATKWEAVSDDQKVWEVVIREGVKFHDGRDLTVEDVIASYNLHKDPQLGSSFVKNLVERVEKAGPNLVRFHLMVPNSEFPWNMAEYSQAIMPAGELDKMGLDGIGTGPFKFAKIDPQRRAVYERFEHYWDKGRPYLESLEAVVQPSGGGAMNGYLSRQFDVLLDIDPGMADQYAKIPETAVDVAKTGSQMLIVLPKYEGSPFADKRIRKALTLAIDRQKIIDLAYGGKYGWMTNDTHMAAFNDDFLPKKVVRDVAGARKLLAEAGHPNGITLPTLYYTDYYPEIGRVFQIAAESVKDAGITMPIEERPKDGYRAWRVEDKEKTRKHRFAVGPVGPRNPAMNLFRMARPEYNESGYWHPSPEGDRYIALYKKAMVTGDTKKRRAIYHEMQRILQEEVPAIFLVGRRTLNVRRSNVHGLPVHPQSWSVRFKDVWKS